MSRPLLRDDVLSRIPADVRTPKYDRSHVKVGIVHLGVGGFHRSHQAAYLDELMSQGHTLEWGICGVGTLPTDRPLATALRDQNGLYALANKHSDGSQNLRVIGSIVEYLFAPDSNEAVIERMTDPAVRIVSLTVTEGGYFRDFATGAFDDSAEPIAMDAADLTRSKTVFGMIAEALRRRRDRSTAPFAVMSCDNIPANGDVTRAAVTGVATLAEPALGAWISSHVSFPNSMVDRITPRTSAADRAEVVKRLEISDGCPVVSEPFTQWVLQDDFPHGRPPLEKVGVQLVADVEPYELMKLRLLNCSHQAMAYFGHMMGYEYVHMAVADPNIAELVRRYMEEATATLQEVPGIDLADYRATLMERFSNPQIRDTLERLCTDGSDRIPNWLVPVIVERGRSGLSSPSCAAIIASWARFCEDSDAHTVVDTRADKLISRAAQQSEDPLAFIRDSSLFGDLAQSPDFTSDYRAALHALRESPTEDALLQILNHNR